MTYVISLSVNGQATSQERKPELSDRMFYDPPSTEAQDDPRRALYARVGDLIIDTTKQRDVNPEKIEKMGSWTWEKAEAITLVEREDGTLAVIEGQHRVIKLKLMDEDIHVWTLVVPAEGVNEAALSKGIATSRKAHNPFEKWDQDRKAGGELENRVTDVLALHDGIYLTDKIRNLTYGNKGIVAVGAVRRIVTTPGTLEEGLDLLDSTITVLVTAFPSLPKKIFEGNMLKAVAGLIYRNDLQPGAEFRRLAERLGATGWTPELWLAEGIHRKTGQTPLDAVTESMAAAYNKGKPKDGGGRIA